MQVKIIYKDGDNSIFTGVVSITEKNDGMGNQDMAVYHLRDVNGNLLYGVAKSQVKAISVEM